MMRSDKKSEKGSLTVEAIISFTVFLMVSFLMLNLVKLTMISLILNNAATETAKQIATAAYPIVTINSLQLEAETKIDEISENGEKLSAVLADENSGISMLAQMTGVSDLKDTLSITTAEIQSLVDSAGSAFTDIFAGIKGKAGQYIAAKIFDAYIESSGMPFDKDNVVFRVVGLPKTDNEFKSTGSYTIKGKKNDLVIQAASEPDGTDNAFNQDDVVICVEYDYQISLPFLPSIDLTLRSTAIEHAWLSGCTVKTVRTEGIKIDTDKNKVYIATGGYGRCYHRKDCRMITLNGKGYIPTGISVEEAVNSGLRPCKSCSP